MSDSLLAACAPVTAPETPIPSGASLPLSVEMESMGIIVPKPQIVRDRFVKDNFDRLFSPPLFVGYRSRTNVTEIETRN
jgi:hypothetical protein